MGCGFFFILVNGDKIYNGVAKIEMGFLEFFFPFLRVFFGFIMVGMLIGVWIE